MYDPYPQETLSFNSLPEGCPVKFLDYGLMTEQIQNKVIVSRNENRNKEKDVLVKKLQLRHLNTGAYSMDIARC